MGKRRKQSGDGQAARRLLADGRHMARLLRDGQNRHVGLPDGGLKRRMACRTDVVRAVRLYDGGGLRRRTVRAVCADGRLTTLHGGDGLHVRHGDRRVPPLRRRAADTRPKDGADRLIGDVPPKGRFFPHSVDRRVKTKPWNRQSLHTAL